TADRPGRPDVAVDDASRSVDPPPARVVAIARHQARWDERSRAPASRRAASVSRAVADPGILRRLDARRVAAPAASVPADASASDEAARLRRGSVAETHRARDDERDPRPAADRRRSGFGGAAAPRDAAARA